MPANQTEVFKPISYRCVCGETVPLHPLHGGQCDSCHRTYSGDVVRSFASETIVFDGDVPGHAAAVAEPDDDPLLGTRLRHFLIVGRIGSGGMGTVYRALDESLQRYVALKVIQEQPGESGSSDDSRHVERLLQEARAQARVKHPNVVHIYFVSEDRQSPFLAMELIAGETLAQRLERGRLRFREVVGIALQTTQALRQAARFDIVHRDIKPSNILLEDGRTVKLSDFGLAERVSAEQSSSKRIVGTPNYLSPEACRGEPTDIRSDMYAVGVMLFEMTFGRLPHTVTTGHLNDRMQAHREAPVEFPDPWPQRLPEGWQSILRRLLAKNPDQRYSDYDELITELQRVRPINLPPAGRAIRGMAYTVDLLLLYAVQSLMFVPLEFMANVLGDAFLPRVFAAGVTVVAPLLASWMQGKWKTSPGKRLLQTRIVDMHGLTPSQANLTTRSVAQWLPVWANAIEKILSAIGLGAFGWVTSPILYTFWVLDGAVGFFRSDRRSIHDLFCGTRVVLDTTQASRTKPITSDRA